MSEVPEEAVRLVDDQLYGVYTDGIGCARRVVAALAGAGWLCDPAEVAALRAVAEAAREYIPLSIREPWGAAELKAFDRVLAALDALAPAPGGVGSAVVTSCGDRLGQ